MTAQQAKNREFDDVVVIWPYQVGGDFGRPARPEQRDHMVAVARQSVILVVGFIGSPRRLSR